jgi:hypothetical protein
MSRDYGCLRPEFIDVLSYCIVQNHELLAILHLVSCISNLAPHVSRSLNATFSREQSCLINQGFA